MGTIAWTASAHLVLQAPERAADLHGPEGPGPPQGLWELTPAPLPEDRLQELPKQLSALSLYLSSLLPSIS